MVFDKLKKLFGVAAGQPSDKPSPLLSGALRPLAGRSQALFERCVAYVYDGSEASVLLDLERAKGSGLEDLMGEPGSLRSYWRVDDATRAALRALGLEPKDVPLARYRYYASEASPEERVRFARVLAIVAGDVERQAPGVPVWLTALLNDLIGTLPDRPNSAQELARQLPHWNAELFVELLVADGHQRDEAESLALVAMIQKPAHDYYSRCDPSHFAGINDLLARSGLTAKDVAGLSAQARVWLMERAEAVPHIRQGLAEAVAALTVDTAKSPRAAALRVLQALPQELRERVIRPVLATVPASRAAELVDLLSRNPQDARLLAEAVEKGAKIGALVGKSTQRMEVLDTEAAEQPLLLPPWQPLPDVKLGEEALAGLRAELAAEIQRCEGRDIEWARRGLQEVKAVTEAQLRALIAIANGEPGWSWPETYFTLWRIAWAVPSLNVIHAFRLAKAQGGPYLMRAASVGEPTVKDMRVVEDAARQAGVHADQVGDDGVSHDDIARFVVGRLTDESWPWFAERQHVLERWLSGDLAQVTSALQVLAQFPHLPQRLLPLVARVALSESRTNRPAAQAVLTAHPAALPLAVQGLADARGEIRAVAASWIAALGDPDGIVPLRTAVKKEKRPAAQAAMLTALEQLGDDISAHLAPEKLYAEATKRLKAKPPASMSWLNLDQLPTVRWVDGAPVDPALLRWWLVLAVKLKNPDGSGLFDRYLSLLDADDAAQVGRFALRSWVAQDTRHPDEAESRDYAEGVGPQSWKDAQDLVQRLRANPKVDVDWLRYAEERAARPVEQFVAEAFRQEQAVYLGSAIADKGMLALTTRMPGVELAAAVQSYIRAHGARRAQVEALVHTLFANAEPAAIQLLLSIARRFKQVTVQARARELVERLADERGWSADELADRTIPTAGFSDDKMLHLSFGEREFLGRVNPTFGIDLTDPDGKPIKALPSPRISDDAEAAADAKKQLSASRKELKAVLTLQSARLYEAMCGGRSWPAPVWQEYVLGHPLMSQLATRLIWAEVSSVGERRFRPTEDGELIDLHDEPIDLDGAGEVRLAHRVHMGAEEADLWRAHLVDYGVRVLFDQLGATTPEHKDGATALENLKGHMTDTFSFRGVATKRGYARGMAEDAGWFTEYSKPFSSTGVTAVLEFTGSYLPEDNIPCATESLLFRRGYQQVPLAEVPPVLLAECYADYVAMAALGPFDPAYRDKAGI